MVDVIVVEAAVSITVVEVDSADAVFVGMLRHKHALEMASVSISFKNSGIATLRPTSSAAGSGWASRLLAAPVVYTVAVYEDVVVLAIKKWVIEYIARFYRDTYKTVEIVATIVVSVPVTVGVDVVTVLLNQLNKNTNQRLGYQI